MIVHSYFNLKQLLTEFDKNMPPFAFKILKILPPQTKKKNNLKQFLLRKHVFQK